MRRLNKTNKKTFRPIYLLIAIAIFIVVAGLLLLYNKYRSSPPPEQGQAQAVENGQQSNETEPSVSTKTSDIPSQTASSASSYDIPVVIVDATQYGSTFEIRAYAEVVENGTCTFVFSNHSTHFTRTSEATAGPSTTPCATLDVPVTDFPSTGTWDVEITYRSSSGSYSGTTNKSFTIQ